MSTEHWWNNWQVDTEEHAEKVTTLMFCPSQIPHRLPWAFKERNQRLIT
jgi:hypothetical protein